ncbi:1-acyl-sn-glycerol-3-phosphate acyltransferase [Desulfatibacillum aliphaticivorans]|uniref:1-acyl-sn-glycerol-3-phosphate acyltransferase n=1 Tax=Desulfatibacillum aliphaticivorans TaxID=218208 RepID=UPI00040FB5BC|nr:1-acyl-sn-glycerol-3-phosphate acyltransferase [Desulfatibacillum aliphaticivorans]
MRILNKIMAFFRRWMDRFLQGTYDHFWCHLPEKRGWLTRLMLRLFYTGITVNEDDLESLRQMQKDGIVVFATKYRSLFETLYFHNRYSDLKAPFPEIAFDRRFILGQPILRIFRIILGHIDHMLRFRAIHNPYKSHYFRRQLCAGKSALVSMVSEKGFYKRYVKQGPDPLTYLLRMQMDLERPIYIAPHLFLYGTKPQKTKHGVLGAGFGTEEKPGRFKRISTLFRTPDKLLVEMSEPINLKKFIEKPKHKNRTIEYLSYALRQKIIERINQHRRSVLGPVLKTPLELKETVLRNEEFRRYLQERAISQGKQVQDFHKEVDKYLTEIAAKYNTNYINFLKMCVRWLTDNMFDGVDLDNESLRKFRKASQKGPVVLVPCHKSHIDYLILSYLLFVNNLPCPLIAAGKNLSFFPMGTIFRNCGAFFIRRTFKGAALYSRVFAEYIHRLLEEGFNIEFFLEGGRSRTGKLVLPKFGLLSILLAAYRNGACKNLYFMPIYIGYDRVIEEGEYLHEVEGGQKKAESLSGLVKARKVLKRRYGSIFVRFDEPIHIQAVLSQFDKPFEKMDNAEQGVVCRNLGHRIIMAINRQTVVTPQSLVAAAVLTDFPEGFTEAELFERVGFLISFLKNQEAELSSTLEEPKYAVKSALESFVNDKFIKVIEEEDDKDNNEEEKREEDSEPQETRYKVVDKRRINLEYYKNNCISFFIPAALASLCVLADEDDTFTLSQIVEPYEELQTLFKNEFHYDLDTTLDQQLRKILKNAIDQHYVIPHPTLPETYTVTEEGRKMLGIYASFLKNFFESYLLVLKVMSLQPSKALDKKDRMKKFSAMGFSQYKKGELSCMEAISKITFENAYSFFTAQGIKDKEDVEKIEEYNRKLNRYLSFLP